MTTTNYALIINIKFACSYSLLDGGPDQRNAATYTGQHKHRTNAHKHLWLEWDSNPRLGEDISWLRQLDHCDRLVSEFLNNCYGSYLIFEWDMHAFSYSFTCLCNATKCGSNSESYVTSIVHSLASLGKRRNIAWGMIFCCDCWCVRT
jgi:hypothetical protein